MTINIPSYSWWIPIGISDFEPQHKTNTHIHIYIKFEIRFLIAMY